ncbi:MAG TPA: hypothetical protein VLL54_18870 [Pyrinomonadaceae bacterium]|nr:hypothetical protein [Pyrinomonadaceae bacterium]
MPQRLGKALGYAALIWLVGFAWGTVVFITPALKSVPSIPYVSRFPAISFPVLLISFPVLLIWIPVAYLLARSYLKTTGEPGSEGLRLGVTFAVVNLLLDLLVLVLLFKNGFVYFASLTVWLAYLILIIVPWRTGSSRA